MVFDGIRRYQMVFDCIQLGSLRFVEIQRDLFVFHGIGWYWMVFVGICWIHGDSFVFDGIGWYGG